MEFINNGFGINMLSAIARLIPVWLGHRLATFAANRIVAYPGSKMVRAVRANQWVVRGETQDLDSLDQAVRETIQNSARSIYETYHYNLNPQELDRLILITDNTKKLFQRSEFAERGVVVVGLHISNFDLVLRALTVKGMRPLILTLPDPKGSQRAEFEIRKKSGMNLVPTSFISLRQAIRHLRQGGAVLTGIDRPIPKPRCLPRFFGRAASLPTHHVYLALKTNVPVVVLVTIRMPDGKNHIFTSDPIEMETKSDADKEVLYNAEKILGFCEDFIRRAPNQWSVPLPVWPEVVEKVPS